MQEIFMWMFLWRYIILWIGKKSQNEIVIVKLDFLQTSQLWSKIQQCTEALVCMRNVRGHIWWMLLCVAALCSSFTSTKHKKEQIIGKSIQMWLQEMEQNWAQHYFDLCVSLHFRNSVLACIQLPSASPFAAHCNASFPFMLLWSFHLAVIPVQCISWITSTQDIQCISSFQGVIKRIREQIHKNPKMPLHDLNLIKEAFRVVCPCCSFCA